MMNKFCYFLLLFLFVFLMRISAQEVLTPVSANPVLQKESAKAHSMSAKKVYGSLKLPFFDDFYYYDSSVYPDERLWLDKNVYINSTYSNNAPSIGIATFDALDKNGRLYQAGTYETVFKADMLTSDSIDLSGYNRGSGVWMSFFCQAGGLGEYPDRFDSLVLQFYQPLQKKWVKVWDTTEIAKSIKPFKLVMVPVFDTAYLKSGFQFRFFNYASVNMDNTPLGQASNCDIWNIDYIYINSGRDEFDTAFYDLAITKPIASVLKMYESMPWRHFVIQNVYTDAMATNIKLTVRNNYNSTLGAIRKFTITDVLQNFVTDPFKSETENNVDTVETFSDNLAEPLQSNEEADKAIFKITGMLDENSSDKHMENDTTSYYQVFDNYYAYDDGSAEFGYGLRGEATSSAQVAYKFKMYRQDSLQQVAIFFNRTYNNENRIKFHLMVWDDNNGMPGKVLYDKTKYNDSPYIPDTSQPGFNKFYNYRLDTPILAPQIFYIGWQQTDEVFMNVGFDKNRIAGYNQENGQTEVRLFYNLEGISSSWQSSKVSGALMMRPIVGPIANTVNTSVKQKTFEKLKVYPNPVRDRLYIDLPSNSDRESTSVQFFDISGKVIFNKPLENSYVDVSTLKPGLYIVKVTSSRGNVYVGKVIKNLH